MDNPVPVSAVPGQDERIMAAISHISFVVPYVGVVVPVLVWLTQREKSKYVAFQSLQALAYQIVLFLGAILGGICYMMSSFGMMLTIPFSRGASYSGPGPFFVVPMLVFGIWVLVGLIALIYAVVAAIVTVQGKDFRYIVIGDRLEQYLSPQNRDR